ncbi:P pilus assembly protein, pilin FimA [Enterobacter cloacae]|uniref:P pilus assembly protein, pilin FimA n=1 Tax=Enterobacter cloacae TaxID=550 RepID=A0A377LNA4_ENTCL|nr:P pilus assembly protein, pilin FimA [Enterobacter cloacae]
MMRLFLFISGLLLCASAQAMEWKSDITLSPQPMTYSGRQIQLCGKHYRLHLERLRQRTTGVLVWVCFSLH